MANTILKPDEFKRLARLELEKASKGLNKKQKKQLRYMASVLLGVPL